MKFKIITYIRNNDNRSFEVKLKDWLGWDGFNTKMYFNTREDALKWIDQYWGGSIKNIEVEYINK